MVKLERQAVNGTVSEACAGVEVAPQGPLTGDHVASGRAHRSPLLS